MLSACLREATTTALQDRHEAGALPKVFQEGCGAAESWRVSQPPSPAQVAALPFPAGNAPRWWDTEWARNAESSLERE